MQDRDSVDVQSFLNEHRFSGFQWMIFGLCFVIVLLDGWPEQVRLIASRKAGLRVIQVDARESATATAADEWHRGYELHRAMQRTFFQGGNAELGGYDFYQ